MSNKKITLCGTVVLRSKSGNPEVVDSSPAGDKKLTLKTEWKEVWTSGHAYQPTHAIKLGTWQ